MPMPKREGEQQDRSGHGKAVEGVEGHDAGRVRQGVDRRGYEQLEPERETVVEDRLRQVVDRCDAESEDDGAGH